MIGLQGIVIFTTGGLFSPMVFVMFVPATVNALFDDFRISRIVVGVQLACIWIYAAIHLFTPLPVVPSSLSWGQPTLAAVLSVAIVASTVLGLGNLMGHYGREVFDQQLIHLARARHVALTTQSDRTQELTTLSGEIAHELKNPLAARALGIGRATLHDKMRKHGL